MYSTNLSITNSKKINWHRLLQIEQGSAIVYFSLVLTVLLGFAGLALDGSNAYSQRRRLQTAADAAALAGARALALDETSSQIETDVENMAVANGADSVNWEITNSDKNVNVVVEQEVDTYFARIVGINAITVTAVAEAGYRSVNRLKEKVFPLSVPCGCVEMKEKVMTPPTNEYCTDNTLQSDLNVWYSIWLNSVDPTYTGQGNLPQWHYKMTTNSGKVVENSNGTARITGTVKNQDNQGFTLDIQVTGRTNLPPSGSPKMPSYPINTSNWYYYTGLTGTLTGLPGGRYNGAVLTITRYGPSFQIGTGANMWESTQFGAASWYDIVITKQPTTRVVLKAGRGDINIRLKTCGNGVQVGGNAQSSECHFKWLDWNGGPSTESELQSYIADPSKSGTWEIGDELPEGMNAHNSVSLSVQETLDEWLDKPINIPLYEKDIDDPTKSLICGFATFVLKEYQLGSSAKSIDVEFKPWVIQSEEIDPNGNDFGARDVRLVN